MSKSLSSIGTTLLLIAIGFIVYRLWLDVSSKPDELQPALQFLTWTAKSLVLPLVVWFLLNTGWLRTLPPLLPPDLAASPGSLAWVRSLPSRLTASSLIAASVWGAFTLAWLLADSLPHVRSKPGLHSLFLFWTCVSIVPAALLVVAFGSGALGFAAMLCAGAVLNGTQSLRAFPSSRPLYSRAQAHLKFGRTTEAEGAILAELEQHLDDYDGWMMLADLYAHHFRDLDLADQTVRELCNQPNVNTAQVSLAMHRLADWHLKLAEDPVAARQALQTLAAKLPGSHFAFMAQQRLRQLPASREALREQKTARPLRLPTLKDPLDDADPAPPVQPSGMALARADQLIKRLAAEPEAIPPREELAHLLAEDLGNLEQAIEQIELLLNFPDPPPGKTPAWLASTAAWHLRLGRKPESARRCLERLVGEFPNSPQAFAAQRRLNLLDLESRLRSRTAAAVPPGA
jgi:hypothetical protein